MKGLSSQVFREVGALSRMIQTMSDREFKGFELQKGQFIFVTRICENPGISPAHLSQLLFVDKGTTSKAVKKLEMSGFVERRPDERDGRSWRLHPTSLAGEVYERLIEREERFIDRAFRDFSSGEREAVLGLIRRMGVNVAREWKGE
ncbi:MAG: MarR family transcriptional regulator [Spirochaetales bacterium]|nr:MarR family transcriptional regulator [Spirochaetales bacterium]